MAEAEQRDLTMLTVELLSAYVAKNEVKSEDLAALIKSTHNALTEINAPPTPETAAPEYPPAVTIRKSLASRNHLISMIDGKPYKTLKRHASRHGLTPAEYRQRYNLPVDYPMVAPAYSEHRRNVAQQLGLGRKAKPVEAEPVEEAPTEAPTDEAAVETQLPAADTPKPGRGRKKPATATAKDASKSAEPAPKAPRKSRKAAQQTPQVETGSGEKPVRSRRAKTALPDDGTDGGSEAIPSTDAATEEGVVVPVARRGRRGVKFATAE